MLRNVSLRSVRQLGTPARSLSPSASRFVSMSSSTPTSGDSARHSPARLSQIQSHLNGAARSMSSSNSASSAAPQPTAGRGSGGGDDGSESKVLTMQNGSQTTILLNRPKALNAIDTEMVQLIQEAINACPAENHIVLRGKGRALCSGGDVLAVVNAANSQDSATRQEALTFFQNEFQLDFNIASLDTQSRPRVFVSFMDGITMGGGVGLSVHAPIRVATEKTMFAMPETGIGYWPDVGVTRNLARLDGRIGVYLGMTGARITGEEAYLAGLATHFITSSMVDESVRRLSVLPRNATAEQIADTLDEFSVDPFNKVAHEKAEEVLSKSAFVGARRLALDYAFGQDRAEDVIVALQDLAQGNVDSKAGKALQKIGADVSQDGIAAWASTTLKTLEQKSPRSLKVTFESVRRARAYDISQAFHADMRLATAFCDFGLGRDFYEGVTFTLTKDPKTGKRREGVADWNPRTIEEVSDADVDRIFFGPLEEAKQAGMKMEVPTLQGIRAAPSDAKERKKQAAAIKGIGPLGWERDYNRLALPSEAECEALREGSHPAAGDYTLTVDEIVKILRNHKSDKPGLEFKVKEWLERKQLSK